MYIVAVDISGRHAVNNHYLMVCAAVSAKISPECIERIYDVRLCRRVETSLDINIVCDLITDSTRGLSGLLVAERGDLYNLERWRVESILGRRFKYPESLGERRAIELAHYISVAGRDLIKDFVKEYALNICNA
jgi:hypothetical protein